jgi:uncharacterized cupin superfamily protein
MNVWTKQFNPSRKKEKRFQQVLSEIPLIPSFTNKEIIFSVVYLEPGAEAGNHYHTETEEVFVGFGTIMAVFEDRATKEQKLLDLNPSKNSGLLTAVSPGIGVAHKIINYGKEAAIIIEIATKELDRKEIHDYILR